VTPESAADHAADICMERLEGVSPSLLLAFATPSHAPAFQTICARLRERTGASSVLGVIGAGAMAGRGALEHGFALSAFAMAGEDLTVHAMAADAVDADDAGLLAQENRRVTFAFATSDLVGFEDQLSAWDTVSGDRRAPIVGALVSPPRGPRVAMVANDEPITSGLVAASVGGSFQFDAWVAQGCEGIGPLYAVTRAQGDQILELNGQPAVDAMRDAIETLDDARRRFLSGGLFLGRSVAPHKSYYGRDDFLIRRVERVSREAGAITASEAIGVGETVRFHIRTPGAAIGDLSMVLGVQRMRGEARGALLFSGAGRGESLHGVSAHEIGAVGRVLSPPEAGEELAKAGRRIDPRSRFPIPIAGCFGASEIGPIGCMHRPPLSVCSATLTRPRARSFRCTLRIRWRPHPRASNGRGR
jgi:small ligand-binding sensory domain FIST